MNYVVRNGRRIAVETIETGAAQKKRGRANSDPFVLVPLSLAATLAKATKTKKAMAWILLVYEDWRAKGKPFTFSNTNLAKYGVTREQKRRVLAKLETAGLIKISQQGKQSPVITFRSETN